MQFKELLLHWVLVPIRVSLTFMFYFSKNQASKKKKILLR